MRRASVIFLLTAALAAAPARADTLSIQVSLSVPQGGTSAPPPGVDMWPATNFTAPCNVHIVAAVSKDPPGQEGDTVQIDYFANGARLGSKTSEWIPEFNPSKNARPGQAAPDIIAPAHFSYEEWVWRKPRPGRYVITVKAAFANNPPVTSEPVAITIAAPPPN